MISMCWGTQSIFMKRPARKWPQHCLQGGQPEAGGRVGGKPTFFSIKPLDALDFCLSHVHVVFVCVCVCGCVFFKEEGKGRACWRDILCCSLSERFRFKSIRALDSDSPSSNLGCLTLKLSQATFLSRDFFSSVMARY